MVVKHSRVNITSNIFQHFDRPEANDHAICELQSTHGWRTALHCHGKQRRQRGRDSPSRATLRLPHACSVSSEKKPQAGTASKRSISIFCSANPKTLKLYVAIGRLRGRSAWRGRYPIGALVCVATGRRETLHQASCFDANECTSMGHGVNELNRHGSRHGLGLEGDYFIRTVFS